MSNLRWPAIKFDNRPVFSDTDISPWFRFRSSVEVGVWRNEQGSFILFNVYNIDRLERIYEMGKKLTEEQRKTMGVLAQDWAGTAEELFTAVEKL